MFGTSCTEVFRIEEKNLPPLKYMLAPLSRWSGVEALQPRIANNSFDNWVSGHEQYFNLSLHLIMKSLFYRMWTACLK